jgi:hypothetical protein
MRDGKHRDFNVDTKGKLLLVEEETSIDTVPAPARAAIQKKVADGELGPWSCLFAAERRCTKRDTPRGTESATRCS